MPPLEPTFGATVEVPAGRGIVRYAGATQFSPGKWVGIELAEPKGKNDGSVMGVTYFSCKMNYGVFVRASQVRVLDTGELAVSDGYSVFKLRLLRSLRLQKYRPLHPLPHGLGITDSQAHLWPFRERRVLPPAARFLPLLLDQ